MTAVTSPDRRRQLVINTVFLPTLLAVALLGIVVGAVLEVSTVRSDDASIRQQTKLVQTALRGQMSALAKDQEASTNWDDAVLQVNRRPLDVEWVDLNLGSWFHDFYGHDEAYVLDGRNRPIFAMRGGQRLPPQSFKSIEEPSRSLVSDLRQRLAREEAPRPGATELTLGALDIRALGSRPAIISVKPIVSETGKIPQAPGSEHLHISVRYLDGSLPKELAATYDIQALHFAWTKGREASLPLLGATGQQLGYLNWQPFRPGMAVAKQLIPVLLFVLALIGVTIAWLLMRVVNARLETEASRARAEHLALHDPLTGLPNRTLLAERLDQALRRPPALGGIALVLLDLDRFKNVNDTLGHLAGDALIVQFARRLTDLTRPTDTVARLGGDEFAVLRTSAASHTEVEQLCEQVLSAVRMPFEVHGAEAFVGVSLGVIFADPSTDRTELLRKADIALYFAKDEGRDCYRLFAPEMDADVQWRGSLEDDLRCALEGGGELEVHYQPQVRNNGLELLGMEALIRWNHPTRGRISPEQFVPVAETTGLIRSLGDFVMREACRASARWPDMIIAVNVSPVQLRDRGFARRLRDMVKQAHTSPSRIQLEITETILLGEERDVLQTLNAVKRMGFSIALDDFGVGYSSLSYLRRFKVDKIKIDRSFVQSLGKNADTEAIISAVLALGRAMGLTVTAEGVETIEQRDFLSAAGCAEMQGYLFGAAMSEEEMDRLVSAKAGSEPQ